MRLCEGHNPVFRSAINLSTVSIVESKDCKICLLGKEIQERDKTIEQLRAKLRTANEALNEYRSSLAMRH